MIVKLQSTVRKDFTCEIETEANLVPVIREYGTSAKAVSRGYYNPTAERKDFRQYRPFKDVVYGDERRYSAEKFLAYRNSVPISPSDTKDDVENKTFQGDIRRVLADILYVLYLECKGVNPVTRLKWRGTVYSKIEKVSLQEDERIRFEAEKEDGTRETILLPVPLNERRSLLSKYSPDIYVLKAADTDLELAFSLKSNEPVLLEQTEENITDTVTMNFFYGSSDGKRGIFYGYGKNWIPFCAVTGDGDLVYSDFLKTTEEQWARNLSKEERDYFCSHNKRCKSFPEAAERFQLMKKTATLQPEWKVVLNGEEYIGVRDLDKYKFSGITFDNVIIDCEVQPKTENGEYRTSGEEKWSVALENQEKLVITEKELYYHTEQEPLVLSITTLEQENIISNGYFREAAGKTIEQWLSEVKTEAVQLAEEFLEYVKDEKKLEHLKKLEKSEKMSYFKEREISKVAKMLYPAPLIPDPGVAKKAYEAKRCYENNGKAPCFAIMGGPGCGKTKLAGRLAAYMKGSGDPENSVLVRSTSDLKGAYVGHTANRVFKLLKEAYEKEKVVFIDEAYNLQADQFGREALELLLPLISGDRTEIECVDLNDKDKVNKLKFEKGVPWIWLAGYEHELRKMLVENPGLYRRMIRMPLTAPTVEGLYDFLFLQLEEEQKNAGQKENLRRAFEECKKEIKNYFGWAIGKEHITYFGNYDGVKDFYMTCEVYITGDNPVRARECILEVIENKKQEIRKQYKAILTEPEKPKFEVYRDVETTLDEEVKGYDNTVSTMRQIIKMLMSRESFEREGIHVPKGALLVGPPGTGKTRLARGVAGEIQKEYNNSYKKEKSVAFLSVAATELNTPQKVSVLFEEASEYDSCVIFIDELDAIGMRRELSRSPEVLIQLMKEMDGFEERKNIFVMAATNAPEALDPALKRPGRFDRTIEMTYPEEKGRREILSWYLEKLKIMREDVDDEKRKELVTELAEKTRGYVPAELKNLVNEAAILYKEAETGSKPCKHREGVGESVYERFRADLLEMLERLRVGELVEGKKEESFQTVENTGSSAVAIHEVGHALVSVLLEREPFEKITIISRGDALGYVSPSRKNKVRTKKDILREIKILLGGRVAEEIFYGEDISLGAVQDIQQATSYAENMVMLYGMSEEIGPMAMKTYEHSYLRHGQDYRCSERFRSKAEEEIHAILKAQLAETRGMLKSKKDVIEKLAKYIFEREALTGEEFMEKYREMTEIK